MDVPSSVGEILEGPIEPEDPDEDDNGPVFSGEMVLKMLILDASGIKRYVMSCYVMNPVIWFLSQDALSLSFQLICRPLVQEVYISMSPEKQGKIK